MSIDSDSINDSWRTHPFEAGADSATHELLEKGRRQITAADREAFWRLWKEHEKYLYRICLRQLDGIQEEAEDALSILMVKLLDLLPRYSDHIENLRAWLAKITFNLCIDIRRDLKRSRMLARVDDLIAGEDPVLSSSEASPEHATLRLESREFIYSAIGNLPENLRVPFLLRHLYEWPYDEIALCLEISPGNARKRSQLARDVLRRSLEKYVKGGAAPCARGREFDPEKDLQRYSQSQTITPKYKAVRVINVIANSGLERSFCIHLNHRPTSLSPKIEQVTRYTSSHPGGWKKHLELAQLLYEAGDWSAAIGQYEHVLEKQPTLLTIYLELGNLLSLMDNRAGSIATYQKALQFIAAPDDRRHLRGMIALRRGNYQAAIVQFGKAIEIRPDKVAHWNGRAMVHLLSDSPLEALRSWSESLRIDPNNPKALTHLPGVLFNLGRVKEASRYVAQALHHHAGDVLSITALADHRSQRRLVTGHEGSKTRKLIEQAICLAADSPMVQNSLSWFHLCRGEWQEGVNLLRVYAERHRSSPEAWRYYARAAYRTGDVQTAAEAIRHAYSLDPNSWTVNLAAGDILSWQRPSTDLRALFEGMLGKFFERWTVWARIGLALIRAFGDAERAVEVSAEAPRLQPQLSSAWFAHSRVLALANRYGDAVLPAEIGWRWLPDDEDGTLSVPAACRLAENFILMKDPSRSEAWANEATVRLPELIAVDPSEGYYWEGKLRELSRDRPGALRAYQKSLEHHLFLPKLAEVEAAVIRLSSPALARSVSFPIR